MCSSPMTGSTRSSSSLRGSAARSPRPAGCWLRARVHDQVSLRRLSARDAAEALDTTVAPVSSAPHERGRPSTSAYPSRAAGDPRALGNERLAEIVDG
jgi:hypothetical protein